MFFAKTLSIDFLDFTLGVIGVRSTISSKGFLDFLSFPCTKGCSSNKQWLIRFKMVEPKRGDIIFWVRKKYELPEDFENSENFKELASQLSLEVVDEFAKNFIIPWQILRYNNLSQNSNQNFQISLKK